MVLAGLAQASKLVSYPSAVVTDSKGRFAGFLMRLVQDHQPIHHLYAPGDRKANFPAVDYRFLVHTARNLASAVADVHSRNCVIGDINHSGILVSNQAIVALIDADSFQITQGAREFLCSVGVPEYTPPELQGRSLAGLRRTENHDAFGLAVIVFQLLCMGRHPFVGSYVHGEMPMEKAITEHRFAYSQKRAVGMQPPPGTITLNDFPQQIGAAFEAAFDPAASRPGADQWVRLLTELGNQLRRCSTNSQHYYPQVGTECPWCRMERSVPGLVLFLPPIPVGTAKSTAGNGTFNLKAVWSAIEAVRLPPVNAPAPTLPAIELAPTDEALSLSRTARGQRAWNLVLVAASVGGVIGAPAMWLAWLGMGAYNVYRLTQPAASGNGLRQRLTQTTVQWNQAIADWERRCGGPEVHSTRGRLADARQELECLPGELQKRLAAYESKRREFQLKAFLESHRISSAKIQGIGPGRKATLTSWGIDNASQVNRNRILGINGFGPAKANALMAWRHNVEARFKYDPRPNATDARERGRITAENSQRESHLRAMLAKGANDLATASQVVQARWKTVDQTLLRAHHARVQAEVDDAYVNASFLEQFKRTRLLVWMLAALALGCVAIILTNLPNVKTEAPKTTAPTASQASLEKFDAPRAYRVAPSANVASVNVRAAADQNAAIVEKLGVAAEIQIVGRSTAPDGSNWLAYTRGDGSLGYVLERLLKPAVAKVLQQEQCAAGSWIEKRLCDDKSLNALDAQVAQAFQNALNSNLAAGQEEVRQSQQAWLERRDACESEPNPRNCLDRAYRDRITSLAVMQPPVPTSSPELTAVTETRGAFPLGQEVWAARIQAGYPAKAAREEREGRVGVRVTITPQGRVDSCSVISSSGSADLDDAACEGMSRYARFTPALDAEGSPTPGTYSTAIVYKLN